MTTYVLVPGAWHSSTAWDRVVPLLERAGARTVTLDLAATPGTGLREHVEQVIAALDALEAPTYGTASDPFHAAAPGAPTLGAGALDTPTLRSSAVTTDTSAPTPGTPGAATTDTSAPTSGTPASPSSAATTKTPAPTPGTPEPPSSAATPDTPSAPTPPVTLALTPAAVAHTSRSHTPTPLTSAHDRGPVILVGHSYAGLVVRQAADRRPERVQHIVLIDGWAGPDGAGLFTLAPEAFADRIRAAADESGLLPAPPPAAVGVEKPDDVEWLRPRLRPHPLRTFTDTTTLTGAVDRIPGTALYCRPQTLPFEQLAEKLGYRTVPVDGPHDVMVTDPESVARLLLDIPQVQNQEAAELQ
ncbi:alpha/beta fold hydrolase, partial [Nonomuraea sp. RK-328]|nr:alpha/beta fold hydrolase [Nonomuraea sp. RK-328]